MLNGMADVDDRYARRLYALLMFEMWNRVFVDRQWGREDQTLESVPGAVTA
jgi:hypothetical protein